MSTSEQQERNKVKVKARYDRNVREGKCGWCGEPALKHILCDSCREKDNIQKRGLYTDRRARGVCVRCQKPSDGKASCSDCTKLQTKRQKVDRQRRRERKGAGN